MRISDWSSDVCSSDLIQLQGSSLGGRVEWIIGGFYSKDRPSGPMGSQFRQFDFLRDGPTLVYSSLLTRNSSKALFGQASIDLSDAVIDGLKLNLGYRHTWDKVRSEEHKSELQSLMRISYAVFCL